MAPQTGRPLQKSGLQSTPTLTSLTDVLRESGFLQIAQLSVLNTHTEFHHRIFPGYGDIRCFTRYVTADELFSRYVLLVRAQCAMQINLYVNVLTSGTLAIRLSIPLFRQRVSARDSQVRSLQTCSSIEIIPITLDGYPPGSPA